eukprot:TRINITY_DN9519_c0_g1_i1.p1 TRINITY_DN9519_c0_g1~~TRINITY_DN9519_c0_g1_i1.p1  ORF type:complete len:151 (+),score=28.97 TRINITY_DN9519_c0_g1_i1:10-462(+)
MAEVPLPRNFKLLVEYEHSIGKDGKSFITGIHTGLIQYGSDDSKDDPLLHYWQGMIFGPQNKPTGEVMYTFTCFCSDKYPAEPPVIRFTGPKVVMPAVDSQGNVNLSLLNPQFKWEPRMNIADALVAIRQSLSEGNVPQLSFPVRTQSYT